MHQVGLLHLWTSRHDEVQQLRQSTSMLPAAPLDTYVPPLACWGLAYQPRCLSPFTQDAQALFWNLPEA